MEKISYRLTYKTVQFCIIMAPAWIWIVCFLLYCGIGYPTILYKAISLLLGISLVISTLFLNAYITIIVKQSYDVEINYIKNPHRQRYYKSLFYGLPLLIFVFLFQFNGFILYGFIQLVCMLIHKQHYSMNDMIYRKLTNRQIMRKKQTVPCQKEEVIL